MKKGRKYYGSAMDPHMEVTSVEKEQQQKCFNPDFTGQQCSRMLRNCGQDVMSAKELVI